MIYGIGDFSAAVANYAQEDKVANFVIDFIWTEIGLGYSFGAGSVSYGSSTKPTEIAGFTIKDTKLTSLSVSYNLGEGVSLVADNYSGDISSVFPFFICSPVCVVGVDNIGSVVSVSETLLGITAFLESLLDSNRNLI